MSRYLMKATLDVASERALGGRYHMEAREWERAVLLGNNLFSQQLTYKTNSNSKNSTLPV